MRPLVRLTQRFGGMDRAVSRSDLVVLTRIGTRQGVARRDFRDLVARHRRTFHVGISTLPRITYVCVLLRGTLYVHYLRPHVHFTCMYVNSLPARSSRSHPGGGMRPRSRPVSSRSRNQFSILGLRHSSKEHGRSIVLQIPNGLKKSGPSRCRARFRDKPAGFGDNPEIHFVLIPTLILHFLTGSRQTNAPRTTRCRREPDRFASSPWRNSGNRRQ